MSIQSNINQGLAIGAALLSQTPRAAEVKEKKAAMKEKKTLTTAKEDLKKAFSSDYNKLAKSFPSIIIAKILGYKIKTYFDGKNMEDDIVNDFKL